MSMGGEEDQKTARFHWDPSDIVFADDEPAEQHDGDEAEETEASDESSKTIPEKNTDS
jgi:hypothetical protein